MTDIYSLSDKAILEALGKQLEGLRLRENITLETLADATQYSINTIKGLQQGRGKLETLVAVLRELHALELLTPFFQGPPISPLDLAKRQGQVRRRASGSPRKGKKDESTW